MLSLTSLFLSLKILRSLKNQARCISFYWVIFMWPIIRLEICRGRRDRRLCKILFSCVIFSRKQCISLQNLHINMKLVGSMVYRRKCDICRMFKTHQFKQSTYYWVPPIAGVGLLGILLSRSAERPFCSSTDALVSRWLYCLPLLLARADPSFLNCSSPTLCQ